jgi:hypothetical protein
MKLPLLAIAAAVEAATGLALLGYPPIVVQLLFATPIAGVGIVISRMAGIALLALGLACWPGGGISRPLCGMLTYNALVTAYLASLGALGEWAGPLLWPVVALHALMTLFLARMWFKTNPRFEHPRLNETKQI